MSIRIKFQNVEMYHLEENQQTGVIIYIDNVIGTNITRNKSTEVLANNKKSQNVLWCTGYIIHASKNIQQLNEKQTLWL
jgi:hypothetical protein